MKILGNSQRGDTIIEVLLAVSVIGLVLGSSYAIANRSIGMGRQAQERTEALKEVETQIERLRARAAISDNGLVDFSTDGAFCINEQIAVTVFGGIDDVGAALPVDQEELNNGVNYPNNCRTGTDGRYGIAIQRAEDFTFTVTARWEPVGGGEIESINAKYRVYPVGNTVVQDKVDSGESIITPVSPTFTPSLGSISTTNNGSGSLVLSSSILSNNNAEITEYGFIYVTSPLDISDPDAVTAANKEQFISTDLQEGGFTATLNGLTNGQEYYIYSYAINSKGTKVEGPIVATPIAPPGFAAVSINNIQNTSVFALTYVTGGVNLNDPNVTEAGHIYIAGNNTSITLDTDSINKAVENSEGQAGIAIDNYPISGLTRNTQYSIRPYVIIDGQSYYGDGRTFTTANNYQIGDSGPGDGKVFYDKGNSNGGWRFMEAFVTNTSRYMGCSDPGSKLGDNIGNGLLNTNTMVSLCGSGSPIGYASSFTRSDEDDWFIPSYHELNTLITNRSAAGLSMSGSYWTSSNSSSPWTRAFYYRDANGGGSYGVLNETNDTHKIVVVRRF